jgi:hypothetical protein
MAAEATTRGDAHRIRPPRAINLSRMPRTCAELVPRLCCVTAGFRIEAAEGRTTRPHALTGRSTPEAVQPGCL